MNTEPTEAWSNGIHTVRLWISSAPNAMHTVVYGKASFPEFSDTYRDEGAARLRYEELRTRYEAQDG